MRKRPQQKRSRELVSRLVDSTACCITQHGLDALTTHQVAEHAGVSVGSLYQYFESKDDLVEALLERVVEQLSAGLNRLVLSQSTELRPMVELAVNFGFTFLRAEDGLAMELVRSWHQLPTERVVRTLQDTLLDFMRFYLLSKPLVNNPQRLQVRSFIIANALVFTMIRALSDPTPFVRDEDLKLELIQMVVSYLEAQ